VGLIAKDAWANQLLNPKFRMLDGSLVYRDELDALRSNADAVL